MEVLTKRGQLFTLRREEPYVRKNGGETVVRVWAGHCAKCGGEYEITTPKSAAEEGDSKAFGMKHCALHKLSKAEVAKNWGLRVAEGRKRARSI